MTTIAKRSPACQKTSASSAPVSRPAGIEYDDQAGDETSQWPLAGPFAVSVSDILVAVAFLDHDAIVVTMPARMPIAMHAVFRAGATPIVVMATLDHDGLGACDRRRCNSNRTDSRDEITNLPHDVLLTLSADLNLE